MPTDDKHRIKPGTLVQCGTGILLVIDITTKDIKSIDRSAGKSEIFELQIAHVMTSTGIYAVSKGYIEFNGVILSHVLCPQH